MSWHTSVIFIAEPKPNDFGLLLERLGFSGCKPRGTISFEDATSPMAPGKSVAHANGWSIICDPMFFTSAESLELPDDQVWIPSLDQRLREISATGTTVFGFITEGGSGTHGFTLYENGNRRRMWLVQMGDEVVANEGAPLPEEKECFGKGGPFDPEHGLLRLMEEICVPFDTLDKIEFQVFPSLFIPPLSSFFSEPAEMNTDDFENTIAQSTDTSLPACCTRASDYLNKGEYDSAIAEYTEAIRFNPGMSLAHQARGGAYFLKGEFEKAIADYTEAIRLAPNDGELYASRGLAYEQNGSKVNAEADFAQAKKLGYNLQ